MAIFNKDGEVLVTTGASPKIFDTQAEYDAWVAAISPLVPEDFIVIKRFSKFNMDDPSAEVTLGGRTYFLGMELS